MNDHADIVNSVLKIQFWRDHWGWWNASTTGAFLVYRPLMGYVAYPEVTIGLRYGWVWVGWIGFVLYLCSIASSAFLAWRWTRHWSGCVIAATFCVLIRFFNPGQEGLWLVWFSGHQEIIMMTLVLLALATFDVWLETSRKSALAVSCLCFAAGCLVKEYVYIFPIMAFALAAFRPKITVTRKQAISIAALMLVAVLALAYYRSLILTGGEVRNPTIKPIQLVRKPIIFGYAEAGRYLLTGQPWLPTLSLLWFTLAGLWIYAHHALKRSQLSPKIARWGQMLVHSITGPLTIFILSTCIFFLLWQMPIIETIYTFFTRWSGIQRSRDAALMVFDCYTLWLVWKYRRTEMSLVAWGCWMLSYTPVIDYIGWHYTLGPLMLKAVWIAVLVRLIAIDINAIHWWNKLRSPNKSVNSDLVPLQSS